MGDQAPVLDGARFEGDVECIDYSGEAGGVYVVTCSACQETVTVSDHGWGTNECSCGIQWSVSLRAWGWRVRDA